jgi:hypothetical protein
MRLTRAVLLAAGLALAIAGCSGPAHPASSGTGPQAAATPQPASQAAKNSPAASGLPSGASSSQPPGGVQPTSAAGRPSGKTVKLLCQDTTIDMVSVVLGAQSGTPVASGASIFSPTPSSVLVCVYNSQSNELVHGDSVSSSAERSLLAGLQAGRNPAGCPADRPLFAVVESAASPGQAAWVDLDDCARVLRPDNTVGQASSAALKIIDAIGGR